MLKLYLLAFEHIISIIIIFESYLYIWYKNEESNYFNSSHKEFIILIYRYYIYIAFLKST